MTIWRSYKTFDMLHVPLQPILWKHKTQDTQMQEPMYTCKKNRSMVKDMHNKLVLWKYT